MLFVLFRLLVAALAVLTGVQAMDSDSLSPSDPGPDGGNLIVKGWPECQNAKVTDQCLPPHFVRHPTHRVAWGEQAGDWDALPLQCKRGPYVCYVLAPGIYLEESNKPQEPVYRGSFRGNRRVVVFPYGIGTVQFRGPNLSCNNYGAHCVNFAYCQGYGKIDFKFGGVSVSGDRTQPNIVSPRICSGRDLYDVVYVSYQP